MKYLKYIRSVAPLTQIREGVFEIDKISIRCCEFVCRYFVNCAVYFFQDNIQYFGS